MARLIAFVAVDDPTQLRSVKTEGKRVRYIQRPQKKSVGRRSIFMHPCEDHSSPQAVVPVELRQFEKGNADGRSIGMAKVCPLCWTILKHP